MTHQRSQEVYDRFLRQWSRAGWERRLQRPSNPAPAGYAVIDGQRYLDFASNDYLGLSRRRELAAASAQYATDWGSGSRGSRLLAGDWSIFESLERRIAAGTGAEAALIFSSGYQANLGVIAALADSTLEGGSPAIFADRLNHASMHAGCQLAGVRQHRFRHTDYDHLEKLLQKHRADHRHAWILSETVFSMEGSFADLTALTYLARKYDAGLYLDDAHGFGVFGRQGFGRAAYLGADLGAGLGADLVIGTFGKSVAAMGAYVACSQTLRRYLLNRCGAAIYSTALAPPVIGMIEAGLDIIKAEPSLRRKVRGAAALLRRRLKSSVGDCLEGLGDGGAMAQHCPIVPLYVGDQSQTERVAAMAWDQGFAIPVIRYPTVPKGTARLRLSLSAAHPHGELERLVHVLEHSVKESV